MTAWRLSNLWKRDEPDPVIEEMARRIVASANHVLNHREVLGPAAAAEFPGVDLSFYDATGRELAALGATPLGDFQDVNTAHQPAGQRSFYRLALGPDRVTLASWFTTARRIDGQPQLRCLVLYTWLADARILLTSRGASAGTMFTQPPDIVAEDRDDSEPAVLLFERHAQRVREAGSRPRELAGAADVLASRQAMLDRIRAYRRGLGLEFYHHAIRTLLGDAYSKRGPALMAAIRRHPDWTAALDPDAPSAGRAAGGILADTTLTHPRQLGIPAGLLRQADAFELARVWSVTGDTALMINTSDSRERPEIWGVVAAALLKQAARAYQDFDGRPKEESFQRMLASYAAELQNPADPL